LSFFDSLNHSLYLLSELFKGPATSFCPLEAVDDDHTLAASDGSLVSSFKLSGLLSQVHSHSFQKIIAVLTEKTASLFERPGFYIKIVFDYNHLESQNLWSSAKRGRTFARHTPYRRRLLSAAKIVATYAQSVPLPLLCPELQAYPAGAINIKDFVYPSLASQIFPKEAQIFDRTMVNRGLSPRSL